MAPPPPSSSTAAANSQHLPPQHPQPTTTAGVNNNFCWGASLHSVQDTNCPVDWPPLPPVFPLAQQQFYQEFNQQRQQLKKKKARRQQPPQMQQQTTTNNTKGGGKDRRGGNKIHPTAAGKQQPQPAAAPEMLPHSESLNFNLFGQHRKSGRSFSDQDLSKLGRETSTKSLNGGQEQQQQFVNADPQLGQSGGAVSSADSFISAYSYRRPSGTQLAHSPNNSNGGGGGGGTGSSQSTAPIYISNSVAAASYPPYQQQFHPFNRHTSPHPSPVGGGGGGAPNPNFPPYSISQLHKIHRGELSLNEKYRYDLSRAQLKASSRTSALLSGFAMIALVELQYMQDTPKPLLIMLGVVTTLLVSVHLLALMMSTCLLPYIEANGCTQDSPHIKLKFYIELSWIFSTCIGLLLFLLEIGVIFFVKFNAIGYNFAAYITTGMLIPVLIIFIVISYLIHRNRFTHSIERVNDKVVDLQKYLVEAEMGGAANQQQTSMGPHATNNIQRNMVSAGLQGVTVVRNFKD